MMNLKNLTLILIYLFSGLVIAQVEKTPNQVGETITIESEILNEKREIQIFLPVSYNESDETYPVLYVLDGQRYFLHAVSLHQSFTGFKQTPEFIVVGITKTRSERNRNFSSNSKNYLNHIEQDIIGYVDSNYRTSSKRLLFGWAFAGGFTTQAMIYKPVLFDAYIAASPFPLSQKINAIDSLLEKNPNFDKFFYFSSDVNEGSVVEGTHTLDSLLKAKAPKAMNWTFKAFTGEEHRSTPFSTLYHGISNYFKYYPELQFNNLQSFINSGGLDYVYDYYEKRASLYGFSPDLSDWTMFSITRNAMRADDYVQFEALFKAFESTGFISRLRISRACSIAEFFSKKEQYTKAIELFTILAEKHPESSRPLQGLGDAYKALGQNDKATLFYEKAKKLSED